MLSTAVRRVYPMPPKPYIVDTETTRSLHFGPELIQSRMLRREPDTLVFDYTRTMMGFLLFLAQPRQVAMIGLGGGSLAKFCHRFLPLARIEVVEIDADVIALRDEFQVPRNDRRFSVRMDDGARFVAAAQRRFDVILLDGYDAAGMPARLAAAGFVEDCRGALRRGGLLVVNLARDDPNLERFRQRLRRHFDGAVLGVDDADQGNHILFAGTPLRRRVGEIARPATLPAAAWAQLVLPCARLRRVQHAALEAGTLRPDR